jgi:hypothetical protein
MKALQASIGGYLELEFASGPRLSPRDIPVDLGRHALEILIKTRGYKRLLAPRYTCGVLGPAIERANVELTLYDLDDFLEPVFPQGHPQPGEALLYTNYYGLKQDTVEHLKRNYPDLILDYAQDFYGSIPPGVDAFRSCRKFLGLADGALLQCDAMKGSRLQPASAQGRYDHLLVAADQGIEAGFPLSQAHENRLQGAPVRGMSNLTAGLLAGIDHNRVQERRRKNRDQLHNALHYLNQLPIDPAAAYVPMTYPFRVAEAAKMRAHLINRKIFTPRYWPDLLAPLNPQDGANLFLDEVVYLPVDQRYGEPEMNRVLEVLMG